MYIAGEAPQHLSFCPCDTCISGLAYNNTVPYTPHNTSSLSHNYYLRFSLYDVMQPVDRLTMEGLTAVNGPMAGVWRMRRVFLHVVSRKVGSCSGEA